MVANRKVFSQITCISTIYFISTISISVYSKKYLYYKKFNIITNVLLIYYVRAIFFMFYTVTCFTTKRKFLLFYFNFFSIDKPISYAPTANDPIRAFISNVLKILAFNTSKSYFIYFNNSIYNTPYIKSSIFTYNSLK